MQKIPAMLWKLPINMLNRHNYPISGGFVEWASSRVGNLKLIDLCIRDSIHAGFCFRIIASLDALASNNLEIESVREFDVSHIEIHIHKGENIYKGIEALDARKKEMLIDTYYKWQEGDQSITGEIKILYTEHSDTFTSPNAMKYTFRAILGGFSSSEEKPLEDIDMGEVLSKIYPRYRRKY